MQDTTFDDILMLVNDHTIVETKTVICAEDSWIVMKEPPGGLVDI